MGIVLVLVAWNVYRGEVSPALLWIPAALCSVLLLGIMGLGLGIIVSSVTTKYRDLAFLVGFGLQLWMYASPVIYPVSQFSGGLIRILLLINPVSAPMEMFRLAFLGTGSVSALSVCSSVVCAFLSAFAGIVVFNRVERSFIDIV